MDWSSEQKFGVATNLQAIVDGLLSAPPIARTMSFTLIEVGEGFAVGVERAGVGISPMSPANGVSATDPQAQFNYIVEKLDEFGIAYLHVV